MDRKIPRRINSQWIFLWEIYSALYEIQVSTQWDNPMFLAKRGEVTVPEFKEMTGLSRKYIIPLLEHFDATKVTLRVGDKRVLRKGK